MTRVNEYEGELVTSLERGLDVLTAFGPDRRSMTLSDVAKATGLDRSGVRRLLHTLVRRGYLRTDGQLFALHPRVAAIGNAYLEGAGLPEVALPHLRTLGHTFGEPATLAVLDGADVVVIARSAPSRLMSVQVTVGSRIPADGTALGRMLLAGRSDDWLDGFLASAAEGPRVDPVRLRRAITAARSDGFATVEQDMNEAGLCAVAVPVTRHDRAPAALGMTSHVVRRSVDDLVRDAVPALRAAADRIERDAR